ncbi:MAG: zinc ribbon domain-containing protein [Alphaproteobacteria bacterium]|nr:zinc ribbon domain-containing protein [Alphaproteobacteria bacterium]
MADFGILGFGAYLPQKRISRKSIFDAIGWINASLKPFAKGARAYANWDEDPITMGVAAAQACLAHAPQEVEAQTLCFASTTAPFLDRQNAGIIAAALDLPKQTHCYDFSGSQRAALSALIVASQNPKTRLLLTAAEQTPIRAASTMEILCGDAAAALLIGEGKPLAKLHGTKTIYADFVDHYRTANAKTDYVLEERWYRDEGLVKFAPQAILPLLEEAGIEAAQIAHFIAPVANPALARHIAAAVNIKPTALADSLFDTCGYAGAAHALLMLVQVLEKAKAGDWILATAFGQGCEAILLQATDAITDIAKHKTEKQGAITHTLQDQLAQGIIENNYTKFLAASGRLDIDWGMRAERDNRTAQSVAYAKSRALYGFIGGICSACQTPQFPKSHYCVNPECGALDTQTDYSFARRLARVKSFTEDWLAFTRDPPLIYGNLSFEGGGNIFMEMTGCETGEIAIGDLVAMQFRIKDIDTVRDFKRYFWKAVPVRIGKVEKETGKERTKSKGGGHG